MVRGNFATRRREETPNTESVSRGKEERHIRKHVMCGVLGVFLGIFCARRWRQVKRARIFQVNRDILMKFTIATGAQRSSLGDSAEGQRGPKYVKSNIIIINPTT